MVTSPLLGTAVGGNLFSLLLNDNSICLIYKVFESRSNLVLAGDRVKMFYCPIQFFLKPSLEQPVVLETN